MLYTEDFILHYYGMSDFHKLDRIRINVEKLAAYVNTYVHMSLVILRIL